MKLAFTIIRILAYTVISIVSVVMVPRANATGELLTYMFGLVAGLIGLFVELILDRKNKGK